MAAKLEEITGIFIHERNRWDQTIIGEIDAAVNGANGAAANGAAVRNILAVKGPAEEFELEAGITYRFYGRYVEHPRYGRQFHFQTFTVAAPHGKGFDLGGRDRRDQDVVALGIAGGEGRGRRAGCEKRIQQRQGAEKTAHFRRSSSIRA